MAGPKYLLVGNLTIDVTHQGETRGGEVWFGAPVADTAHQGAEPFGRPSSAELHPVPRRPTMTFENSETPAGRADIGKLDHVWALARDGQATKILPPEVLTIHRDGAGDVLASAFCRFLLKVRSLIDSAQEAAALAIRFVVDGLPAPARPNRELVR